MFSGIIVKPVPAVDGVKPHPIAVNVRPCNLANSSMSIVHTLNPSSCPMVGVILENEDPAPLRARDRKYD